MDLGSGRGYLSETLALDYGLKVLGIDSCAHNSASVSHAATAPHHTDACTALGAQSRNALVQRSWLLQARRAQQASDATDSAATSPTDTHGRSFVPVTATVNCESDDDLFRLIGETAEGGWICFCTDWRHLTLPKQRWILRNLWLWSACQP